MFRLLNQPYPREENPLKRLRFVSISAVIVFLFLWVFRPFGIDRVEVESLDLFIAGYGLVTFLVAGTTGRGGSHLDSGPGFRNPDGPLARTSCSIPS